MSSAPNALSTRGDTFDWRHVERLPHDLFIEIPTTAIVDYLDSDSDDNGDRIFDIATSCHMFLDLSITIIDKYIHDTRAVFDRDWEKHDGHCGAATSTIGGCRPCRVCKSNIEEEEAGENFTHRRRHLQLVGYILVRLEMLRAAVERSLRQSEEEGKEQGGASSEGDDAIARYWSEPANSLDHFALGIDGDFE